MTNTVVQGCAAFNAVCIFAKALEREAPLLLSSPFPVTYNTLPTGASKDARNNAILIPNWGSVATSSPPTNRLPATAMVPVTAALPLTSSPFALKSVIPRPVKTQRVLN